MEGHSFAVGTGAEMEAFLQNQLDSAVAYDVAFHRILGEHSEGLTVRELVTSIRTLPS